MHNSIECDTSIGPYTYIISATILGHLLPMMLTAMTHHNLRCLQMAMADNFMPQLVQLVVLTSQVCSTNFLFIKSSESPALPTH